MEVAGHICKSAFGENDTELWSALRSTGGDLG